MKFYKWFIPKRIKNYIKRKIIMLKYDALLYSGADGSNTVFEGNTIF